MKIRPIITLKIVCVEWVDSCSIGPAVWHDPEYISEVTPHQCATMGWLVEDADDYIVLVSGHTENQYSGVMCIPKGCIKTITVLEPRPSIGD